MKMTLRLAVFALVVFLTGCASGPYYYGGTGYRMHNIGGLPVSGSFGVNVTPGSLMLSPNLVISPSFLDWKR
ncbi:hypothetical protein Q8O96_30940 [Pseudomonas sp. LPH60]|uniref:hypothetical protein n=1 Tax=Pseudomonas sp. LPH60 TaxID=3065906 RepID=UPI00273BFBFA|nr:hypothetical protein [Pseudomonas sp. LPH60]MDP4573490.1 hypothetical protein [Pseudomonas sp. LPH60]